jgi:hypothetical protein
MSRAIHTLFVVSVLFFASSASLAWIGAGIVIHAHERDLCFLDANCKKV